MTDTNVPSTNPANLGSMSGMMREILGKFLQNTDDMLPAKVLSYDRATRRAKVQALIMAVKTDNSILARAPVASVPVIHLGGGGFLLDFNLKPGDLGWIKANDRDISLFLQSFNQSPPNTYRKHTFEDAVFIPDVMHGFTINSEDAENVVLQTLDGTQRVAIWADRVKITSDTEIIIDAPLTTFTGAIAADSSRAISNAVFNGIIRATGDIIAEDGSRNVSLNAHVHGGVQTGSGDTGEPV